MNRIVRSSFAIVAAALTFSAAETQAQVGFSIAGGPSFATGDFGDGVDMGYHAKVAAAFSLPMLPIGLEADGMWTRFNFSNVDDAHVQMLSGTLNAVINLPTPGITPYIIGGVGLYNSDASIPNLDTESSNDFGVNIGAGVRMGLVGLGGVFAEARLHNIFTGDDDGATDNSSVRFIPVSLGIRF